MKPEMLKILKRGFPQNLIKKRKGLGGTYDFVTGNSVQDRLDEAFQGDWSWEVNPEHGYKIGKEWVYVVGVLTAYLENGEVVRKSGEGAVQVKRSNQGNILDLGFDISAASTKALKKAASRLGIAREIEVAEPDDTGSKPADKPNPRLSRPKAGPSSGVFPDDVSPERIPDNVPSSTGDATPVQVEAIKNKVSAMGINILEVIRKGLNREDVPDQPENLTREEAKKVLVLLNNR